MKKGWCNMKLLNGNRMRLVVVGIVAAIVVGAGSAKADFTWTQKADMPTPRWGHTSAVVDGKIYVIGGGTSEGGPDEKLLATVEEYDPVTNTWTRKDDMPTPRGWMSPSSAVVDGKIYVIGGGASWDEADCCKPTVEEYDPATDTWTRKADMPTGRDSLATVAVDAKIYAIGGLLSWDNLSGLRTVEEYDPATDTWTRKADIPRGVWGLCASVVSGKIYAMGGRPSLQAVPLVQEYDPVTDTWTLKGDMPVATSQMGSAVLGNKIVLIGGWLWSANFPYTTVQIYEPETDIWTREDDAPFQRAVFSADVVNNRIYAIGGTDRPHPCPATSTVYELTVNAPPPDFNGDGFVDSADICIMIDHWGTSDSLCDIAPPPFGDGIVDVQDLIVLSENLFEEVDDPTLVAHWALDDIEGDIASDSANDNDGTVYGDPAWQPEGGMVDGALQLDGIDDYVSTPFVLNPADGKFSVLAWIKGGAPGQAVLSQIGGVRWLCTDSLEGNLMTELKGTGRGATELLSQTIITDGNWHRIGLVWDGSQRTLYVDDVAVAEDAQTNLGGSENGLYIGIGTAMEAGSFWSGLIDDVRIYNRAVTP
jgi:N-acetylneuraminic acid mutarotase